MSVVVPLPARYNYVGSFVRPKHLLEAHEQKTKAAITPEALRLVQDKAISEIVEFQQSRGRPKAGRYDARDASLSGQFQKHVRCVW